VGRKIKIKLFSGTLETSSWGKWDCGTEHLQTFRHTQLAQSREVSGVSANRAWGSLSGLVGDVSLCRRFDMFLVKTSDSAYWSTLKMETLRSFETSGTAPQTARRRIAAPHCSYTYLHLSLSVSLSHIPSKLSPSLSSFLTQIVHYLCPLEGKAILIQDPKSTLDWCTAV